MNSNSLYRLIEQLQKGLQNPGEIPEYLRWKYFIAAKQAYQFFIKNYNNNKPLIFWMKVGIT